MDVEKRVCPCDGESRTRAECCGQFDGCLLGLEESPWSSSDDEAAGAHKETLGSPFADTPDPVNSPSHYNSGEIRCIECLLCGGWISKDHPHVCSTPSEDPVNSPPHYNSGEIECIDAIREALEPEGFRSYCQGNALKYLWRYKYKGHPKQDLEKAQWYIKRILKGLSE